MTDTQEAPVIDWDAVRLRYEAGGESVVAIAATLQISRQQLIDEARARGWKPRNAKSAKPKSESTRETLRRLKEAVQKRLNQLEGEIGALKDEANALGNERDIRNTNTLVRTLEKVLELEHKERKKRGGRAAETARLNAAQRDELARRIASLGAEQPDADTETDDSGSARTAVGMAPVGET
ncbi:hypothetical protein [Aestuariivirga litoralis]|uniref:hypothetical protein n=1 Tax=Aestuariivirga litoralis TaxID=2650924 RepID=UPI0018C6DD4F|nr:hypothetical protein [Aestuariivirga litoralis]MBG1232233.1 hypothetical protein [Aestuariivirga litoralis]